MRDEITILCAGAIVGACILIGILKFVGVSLNPAEIHRKYTTEAVQLGYGTWVVGTNFSNGNWTPDTHFEWITNAVVK